MKHFSFLLSFSLCLALPLTADEIDRGFEDLKQSFSRSDVFYTKLLDMASRLEPRMFTAGEYISKKDCKALETEIEKNYPHSPFRTVHHDGELIFNLCGDEDEQMNYLLQEKGNTPLGMDFTTVVQVLTTKQSTGVLRNTLLSSDQKIVGTVDLQINLGTQEIESFTVMNVDSVGNLFIHTFESQAKDERTGIEGVETVDKVLLNNGLFVLPIMRQRLKSSFDVNKTVGMMAYYRADTKDWTKYEVLPTFGRGLYEYENEYYTTPIDHSSYIRVFENDVEVCAFGNVTRGLNQTAYPINEKDRTNCLLRAANQ